MSMNTNMNNKNGNNKRGMILSNYPTIDNVHFPLEKPYEVQRALMETMLEALKPDEMIIRGGTTIDNNDQTPKAKIIFLESPTGTGKSLSLACTSLTWLQFMQSLDLQHQEEEEKEEKKSISSGVDWVDAWSPEEESTVLTTSTTKHTNNNNNNKIRADKVNKHRQLLQQELQRIKSGLVLKTRKGLVREHIQLLQQRNQRQQQDQKLALDNKKKQSDDDDDGFCVDEYESDNDKKKNHNNNLLESFSSTDDEDDHPNNRKHQKLQNKTTLAASSTDALSLLNGNLLDGSSSADAAAFGNVQPGSGVRKIIYAARTHSQLSQFIGEMRRATTAISSSSATRNEKTFMAPKVISLGGRSLLCGNESVVRKAKQNSTNNSEAWITEQCLDMQKGSKATKSKGIVHIHNRSSASTNQTTTAVKRKNSIQNNIQTNTTTTSCPLYHRQELAIATLGLHFLAVPSDIEDEALLGKSSQTCAYYASRISIPAADVIAVPYATLLSKQNREAVGLSLKNACIIIDEAHNIPEALRSLKNSTLSLPTIQLASSQLRVYMARYSNRIGGRNLFYISQILKCLKAMIDYLSSSTSANKPRQQQQQRQKQQQAILMSTNELLFALKLDNVNLYKLARYFKVSKLSQKLLGFINIDHNNNSNNKSDVDAVQGEEIEEEFISKHVSAMSFVQNFLSSLNNEPASKGKVIAEWTINNYYDENATSTSASSRRTPLRHPQFRYVLLNPSTDFKDITKEAYAVIFAGGTLSPFTHMCSELLCTIDISSSTHDDPNILMLRDASMADEAIAKAPFQSSSQPFVKWQSDSLVAFSCGHVVPPSNVFIACLSEGPTGSTKLDFRHSTRKNASICDELGLVVLQLISVVPAGIILFLPSYSYEGHLVQRWRQTGLLDKLRQKKSVHREPRQARDTKQSLESYNRDAASKGGALLLSIIGGKMSEGINFADDLARCVVVVGLPYPDISDPILIEKMKSLDTIHAQQQQQNHQQRSNNNSDGALLLTGRSYYHNLCMRAVNQSIGRSFRHANDYAAVVLADFRYASDPKVWNKLPHWLRSSASSSSKGSLNTNYGRAPRQQPFSSAIAELSLFFKGKESK